MAIIATIIVGLVAGFLGQAVGWCAPSQDAGWIASVPGAASGRLRQ
jgi:uncharacterized membrane protein YeaQ/YmgE (transglycosylase-associated protein family)